MKQRRYKLLWGVLALVLLTAVVLLAILFCPRSPGAEETEEEPVTITLTYAYQNSQWNASIEEVVRQFEHDHPEIQVEYQVRYEDTVYEDLLGKLAARDELGDLVQLKEPTAYAESGLIAPLPQSLAGQVSAVCSLDGVPYAVPALGTTTGIVYNKELFARYQLSEPATYAQFLELCAALKARGITPLGVGGKDLWHLEYWLNHFFRTDILSQSPEFLSLCTWGGERWDGALAGRLFQHLSQLFARGYVDPSWQSTPDSALAYHMAEGEVAMVFSGPWLAANILELDCDAQLGWFYVPGEDGTVTAGQNLDVFWSVTSGCARDEKRYAAAVEFLDYFYSEPIYEETCAAMMGYSSLADPDRGSYEHNDFTAQVARAFQQADIRTAVYVGNEDTPAGFEKQLLSILSTLCQGSVTVEEAQQQTQQAWELCLNQEAAYEGS